MNVSKIEIGKYYKTTCNHYMRVNSYDDTSEPIGALVYPSGDHIEIMKETDLGFFLWMGLIDSEITEKEFRKALSQILMRVPALLLEISLNETENETKDL